MALERVAVSGGVSLAYEVSGDPGAPPMVLLHGLGEGAASWRPVIAAFAAHFRVYALDMPAIRGAVDAGEPGNWDDLPRITAPTLLVGGGPDSSVRQDALADAAARIPHGELVTIPAGHHVHADRPEEFTDAVLGWLRG